MINPNTLEDALSHLQNGEITAVQLVELALSRVSEKESQLHGLITVTKEEALDQAEKIDKARVMGESLGILAGIPITYKDVFFTQGIRSTAGSNVLSDFKPESSAAIVQILEKYPQAHLMIVGGLTLEEKFKKYKNRRRKYSYNGI